MLQAPYTELGYLPCAGLDVENIPMGTRVLVPLQKQERLGIVRSVQEVNSDIEWKRIKLVLEPELLPLWYFNLVRDMSIRYLVSPSKVLTTVLPACFKRLPAKVWIEENAYSLKSLLKNQEQLQYYLKSWLEGKVRFLEEADQRKVWLKTAQGSTRGRVKQAILELVSKTPGISVAELCAVFGPKLKDRLQSLLREGLIEVREEKTCAQLDWIEHTLDRHQVKVVQEIAPKIQENTFSAHLIFGVTGSGKTHVYFELIKNCLKQGKSAFLLLPEIALAWSLFQRAKRFFHYEHIYFYSGTCASSEKRDLFLRARKQPTLIIGTRSSLFLPLSKLGLIIIDEEHVESYKQEQGVYYQTKEIAFFLAKYHQAVLVLGSATPDFKTYYAGQKGYLRVHRLEQRFGQSLPPQIQVIARSKQEEPLSKLCLEHLNKVLAKGEQAIILHNRRGYAPVLYCLGCGTVLSCPHCAISLTYYQKKNVALCHYCGHKIKFPPLCPKCQGVNFKFYGQGTEKLEEYLAQHYPEYNILRLDREVIQRKGELEQVLDTFNQGKAQILIGTQMLGKGHDFPNVTLGIVVDGDLGLNFPDYRARERMFQLLVQLCGRIGRREKQGQVFIQTRYPEMDFWQLVAKEDYLSFYEQEIKLRKQFFYPPFACLGLIRISFGKDWKFKDEFLTYLQSISRELSKNFSGKVMGPVPAVIGYLHSKLRYHILLKGNNWQELREFFSGLEFKLRQRSRFKSVQMVLDLDPISLL